MNGFIALSTVCVAIVSLSGEALARGPLLASRHVATWDGPESKIYWVEERVLGAKIKRPKVDLKRHQITAYMYGPDSITNPDQQLKDISNACLIAGLAMAGAPAVAAAPIGISADVVKTGVKACLETQNFASQLVAPGFEVTIDEKEWFEH